MRKGIILAGGSATRLHPVSLATSKQLLNVYDKPMIYYPLSTLMLAGIKDVLIISTAEDIPRFKRLLGKGIQWGLNIEFAIQPRPGGLAEAFIIGKDFLKGCEAALVLGDNIFFGHGLTNILDSANKRSNGATIFAYHVSDPKRFGVVDFDSKFQALSIEEKPEKPKSNYAVTGLYFYDQSVCDYVKELKPSKRGELEITDLNNIYLENDSLSVEVMGRGYAWLDTGTHDSLLEASSYIATIQNRQGLQVACLEEIAYQNKWINYSQLQEQAIKFKNSQYGTYLQKLITLRKE